MSKIVGLLNFLNNTWSWLSAFVNIEVKESVLRRLPFMDVSMQQRLRSDVYGCC